MTSTPQRLQLSRRAGFNLQQHSLSINRLPAIKVARPTMWGNPFKIETARELGYKDPQYIAVRAFRKWLEHHVDYRNYPEARDRILANLHELRGHNLACFCAHGLLCHADVLLEMANKVD